MNSALTPSRRRRLVRLRRARGLAAFTLATFAGGLPAQEQPTGPVVELPTFVVTDSRELPKPESWRYAQIPGFEVLTSTSDRRTEQLIRDFSLFRDALAVVFPVPSVAAASTPLILVGREGKFDGFIPSGRASTESVTASVFFNRPEQSAIVIDFSSMTVDFVGSGGGIATEMEVDHSKQLYREYVHFLLGRNEPRPPAWLEEGMAQIIMAMRFTKDTIEFGKLENQNELSVAAGQAAQFAEFERQVRAPGGRVNFFTPAEDRDFAAALRNQALMPLPELFAMAHDSPDALNPSATMSGRSNATRSCTCVSTAAAANIKNRSRNS